MTRFILSVLAVVLLSACGQAGPLYLPDEAAEPTAQPPPAAASAPTQDPKKPDPK